MGQHAVYLNNNAATNGRIPFLLDVQSDILSSMATRAVVPLYTESAMAGSVVKKLMPIIHVDGIPHVMATNEIAGIPRKHLGPVVGDASDQRSEILDALDFLLTGS